VTRRYLWILAMMLALYPIKVSAQQHSQEEMEGHAKYHDEFYSKWETEEGNSCCNNNDCAPIDDDRIRIREGELEVKILDIWVIVPQNRIRPYRPPDLRSHLCHIGTHIFCFVYGAGS